MPVPAGTYYVKAEAPSQISVLDEWYDNIVEDGTPGIPGGASVVAVLPRTVVSNVDFSLSNGAEIRGTVTYESGMPIGDDLWVRVYDVHTNQVRSCDALLHVVRNFKHPDGSPPRPEQDFWQIEEDIILNDLAVAEKRIERIELDRKRGKKPEGEEYPLVKSCHEI